MQEANGGWLQPPAVRPRPQGVTLAKIPQNKIPQKSKSLAGVGCGPATQGAVRRTTTSLRLRNTP